MKIDVDISPPVVEINVNPKTAVIEIGNPVLREHVDTDPYTGPYIVTPTQSAQVLATEDLRMTQDLTINPIPSDWGHITWDGSVLTVS